MLVLLVEDDKNIADLIEGVLKKDLHTVETAGDGEIALEKLKVRDYDVVILDLILPKIDGFQVCREIRELKLTLPILMLTARSEDKDKIAGLDVGADDYLAKPFNIEELLARLRALMRREPNLRPTKLQVMDLVLDPAMHQVKRDNQTIPLTNKEYRILEYLIRNEGVVCTRTMVNEHVWGFNYVHSNVIDVHIKRLRDKIDKGYPLKLIHTIRNVGYKIATTGQ